jgi:hypothetical protein
MTNPPFVFEPNPESLEAAARKLFDLQAGKSEIPWVYLPELEKKHWRTKAASTITAYMAAEHAAGRVQEIVGIHGVFRVLRLLEEPTP